MNLYLLNMAGESGHDTIVIIFAVVFVLAMAALWAAKRWTKVKVWLGRVIAMREQPVEKRRLRLMIRYEVR